MNAKRWTVVAAALAVLLAWGWRDGALPGDVVPTDGGEAYEAILDDLILTYEAKTALASSRSEALREDALEAGRKAEFCVKNRPWLLERMASEELPAKDYRVVLFVNECYRDSGSGKVSAGIPVASD